MSRAAVLGAVLIACAAGGCGGSDEEQAAEPVKTYLTALADSDGDTACDQLTGGARRELATGLAETLPEAGLLTCAGAVELLGDLLGIEEAEALREADIDVTVDGERASAIPIGGTDTIRLVKTADGWLIDGGFEF